MRLKIVTTTGSVYMIDPTTMLWNRNGEAKDYPIIELRSGYWDGTVENAQTWWMWPDVERPKVGESMYIQGRSKRDWWLTTPVVSVEEM